MKKLILITVILMLILSSCSSADPTVTENATPTVTETSVTETNTTETNATESSGTDLGCWKGYWEFKVKSIDQIAELRELAKLDEDDPRLIQGVNAVYEVPLYHKQILTDFLELVDTFPIMEFSDQEFCSFMYNVVIPGNGDEGLSFMVDFQYIKIEYFLEGHKNTNDKEYVGTANTKDGKITVKYSEPKIAWAPGAQMYRISCFSIINGKTAVIHYWVDSEPESVDFAKIIYEAKAFSLQDLAKD